MTGFLPNIKDEDGSLAKLLRDQEREAHERATAMPERYRFRQASSLSPVEQDDLARLMGWPRDSTFAIRSRQAKWESDPAAVAARDQDIHEAIRLLAQEVEQNRARGSGDA